MLFTSLEFLFFFLPITTTLFFVINHFSRKNGMLWLAVTSLFFYSWWDARFLFIIALSILFNYFTGEYIAQKKNTNETAQSKRVLYLGIAFNILMLLFFKYTNFIITSLNYTLSTNIPNGKIELPLGISFFTFTQTAYLVDCYTKNIRRHGLTNYVLFVSYYPHLIAGPILHHDEMMPQFNHRKKSTFNIIDISVGLTFFAFGLFKKVIIADNIAPLANNAFFEASTKETIDFLLAWKGSLAYSLQLYFDFSGYSDMAIGLSRLIGIKMPINFHSPYKSTCVIDFWQRWHRTLSRFFRDYLYFPLGGSRRGFIRKYANLATTMLLAGIWHGSGITFIIWGFMHAIYLLINHCWRDLKLYTGFNYNENKLPIQVLNILVCFFAVNIAWVTFRADSISTAITMYRSMFKLGDWATPSIFKLNEYEYFYNYPATHFNEYKDFGFILTCLLITWLLPNTQQIMRKFSPAIALYKNDTHYLFKSIIWKPTILWTAVISFTFAISVVLSIGSFSRLQFLYFQF